jgi:B12-binding domain/radical SAM domain protein
MNKPVLIFRLTPGNRFTIPVLLHSLETTGLDKEFLIKESDSRRSLDDLIEKDRTPCIAYSFMTPHVPSVLLEIEKLRKKWRDGVFLLAGGPHPTGDPEGTLRMGFDAVVCGDGETGLPEFCRTVLHGNAKSGAVLRAHPIADLDQSLPLSSHTAFVPPLEITRGCFHGCMFCQTRGRKPLHRSSESVQEYLDGLVRLGYLFRAGFICPSGFEYGGSKPGAVPIEILETLLRAAKARGIRHLEYAIFPSEVRPNTVTPPFLGCVKKYCSNKKITVGAQTGSAGALAAMKRGHALEDTERASALIREHGFRPQLDFIIGFPDETEEEQIRTLEWIRHLSVSYGTWNQMHFFQPLSGTPLYRKKPSPLSPRVIRMLNRWKRNGYASDWWKRGLATAKRLEKTMEEIERR